jgi:hypothetical protein
MAYVPVGVLLLPPPLLLLLHAGIRSSALTITPSISKPNIFLRRDPADPSPAPTSVMPPIGNTIA